MGRHRAAFRQSDVTRAIAGAVKAGKTPSSVTIDTDGRIYLSFSEQVEQPQSVASTPINGLDRLKEKMGWGR